MSRTKRSALQLCLGAAALSVTILTAVPAAAAPP
ncbi:MAG: hypothetical protein QOD45_1480, partial [Pseudonocardiales bacterium]|nr:hypothetical protein [Pseudonocardiales bacterium]